MRAGLIIILAVCLSEMPLNAQNDTTGAGIGGEYFIHGIFNPTLADADKIDLKPTTYDTIIPLKPVTYSELDISGKVDARVDSITAASLRISNPIQKLYQGYVKGGFGLYTTPLLEFYYDQGRSRENNYGVHLRHFSSNGGLDDVGNSTYSDNNLDMFYNHILDDHKLSGSLLYDRKRVSYYGFDRNVVDTIPSLDEVYSKDNTKRVYNDIGFKAALVSTYEDSSDISHHAGIEAHFFTSDSESKETSFLLTGGVRTTRDKETYSGDLLIDWIGFEGAGNDTIANLEISGPIIGLNPMVSTTGEKYTVEVGAGIFLDATNETTFHFYPRAYAHYRLFSDILIPYIGIDGERQRNSFRSIVAQNPFITQAPELMNTSKQYDIYGGIRGSVSANVGFDVRISNARYDDLPLFVNEQVFSGGEQFALIYDRIDVLDISGEMYVNSSTGLNLAGRIDIFSYGTDLQNEAWNMPPYALNMRLGYDLRDKLLVNLEATFMGERPVLALNAPVVGEQVQVEEEMEGFLDLHFGVEYRYTNRFSVFLDVSNLSASKYERWYGYPIQRSLVLGGATYSF